MVSFVFRFLFWEKILEEKEVVEEARGRKRIKEELERTGVGLLAVVTTPSPCGRAGEGSVSCCDYAPSLAGRDGVGLYIQLCAPKVVARAVRMVMRMLRIFPQVLLLLNVPIVLDVLVG